MTNKTNEEAIVKAALQEQKPLFGNWLVSYQRIKRLGDVEVEGLLDGKVVVQEKIDGANATIAWDSDVVSPGGCGGPVICSRQQVLSVGGVPDRGFRGLVEYVLGHPGFEALFRVHPDWILRGEWLVRHSVIYPAEYMQKLYIFDIQQRDGSYIPWQEYHQVLKHYNIEMVPHLAELEHPKVSDIVALTKQPSALGGGSREGVVVKRYDFVNKHGRTVWGKVIAEDFKEKNKLHIKATKKDPPELRFASAYVTEHLVLKTIEKIRDESGSVNIRDMPEILGRVWYDVFQDELWGFVKENKVGEFDFRRARKVVEQKARDIALAYFNGVL